MNTPLPTTIDGVIAELDRIIQQNEESQNPLGYFAALYRKVTIGVKKGIADGFFDDGPRMEKLDVIFANRYLIAYFNYQEDLPVTESWLRAFEAEDDYWPTVLQHLLVGMNAHINLDLGIAAAEVSKGKNLHDLKNDFDKINELLSSLVGEVQNELAAIWPTLKKILKITKRVDDFLVDFSMEIARNGAWKFATQVYDAAPSKLPQVINKRDAKVARKSNIVFTRNIIVRLIFGIIRIGEKGTVKQKIMQLA